MEPLLQPAGPVQIDSYLSDTDERTLAFDVLDGLTRPFKELPPKHFYDERGSQLFEAICELPEYYPTRTERAILAGSATDIVAVTGAGELVELGSGSAGKTRVLLSAMAAGGRLHRYVPVDVSESILRESATALVAEYPGLRVHGVVGDFERHLDRLPPPTARPGSSPSSAARSATFRRAAAGVCCARSRASWAPTTTCCSAPTWSRTLS